MHPIVQKILDSKSRNIRSWKPSGNRASEAGHPCERFLYYARVAWDKRELHGTDLQMIFEGGQWLEEKVAKDLREAGFNIVEQQRPFHWTELDLVGRIDFKIEVNSQLLSCEVKSMAPQIWQSIDSVEDMFKHKRPWVRGYPAQILLYLLMDNSRYGLFYLINKVTFMPKIISVDLNNYLYQAELILQKIERVNQALSENNPPERIEFSEDYCQACAFFNECKPDVKLSQEADLLDDPELLELLEERERLRESSGRYVEVDKDVKKRIQGVENALIGDFSITGKRINGERKPSPGGPFSYWRSDIKCIRQRESVS